MKKKIWLIAGIALAGLLVLGSIDVSFAQEKPFRRRVLIGFKDEIGHQAAERRKGWLRNLGGDVHHSFRFLPLVSAKLPENLIAKLKGRAEVTYVENDAYGPAIEGATVEGYWSDAYSGNVAGTTNKDGVVSFRTSWIREAGTVTFTVDRVVKNGQEYILAGDTGGSISHESSGRDWRR